MFDLPLGDMRRVPDVVLVLVHLLMRQLVDADLEWAAHLACCACMYTNTGLLMDAPLATHSYACGRRRE